MAFQPAPVQKLISKEYAAQRRALISMDKALKEVQPGTPKQLEEGDTIYMTVADADGMMVSLIQSNYRGMGSGMAPPGLGFILQDRGEMFVLQKNHPNGYAPGKRPFQTIIPAFITKGGKPYASFGVMGGAMQPQGHAQIVMNLVDFGMNLQEAGDAPRIQHEGSTEPTGQAMAMTDGGEVNLETGFPYETVRALMRKGIASCSPMVRMVGTRRSCVIRKPACITARRRVARMGRRRGIEVSRPPGSALCGGFRKAGSCDWAGRVGWSGTPQVRP